MAYKLNSQDIKDITAGTTSEAIGNKWREKREKAKKDKQYHKEHYQGRGKFKIETEKPQGDIPEATPEYGIEYGSNKPGSTSYTFDPSKSIEGQARDMGISKGTAENIKKISTEELGDAVYGGESGSTDLSAKSNIKTISKKKWGGDYRKTAQFDMQYKSHKESEGTDGKTSITFTKYDRFGNEKKSTTKTSDDKFGYNRLMKKRGRVLKRAGKKDLTPTEQREFDLTKRTEQKQKELDATKKSGSGGGLVPGSF